MDYEYYKKLSDELFQKDDFLCQEAALTINKLITLAQLGESSLDTSSRLAKYIENHIANYIGYPNGTATFVGIEYDGYADGYPVYDLWQCSKCDEQFESEGEPPPYKYCPNCGARILEQKEA